MEEEEEEEEEEDDDDNDDDDDDDNDDIFLRIAKQPQFNPLQNVVYFKTLLFWFVKYSHFT